jgi:hypothetical protein
VAEPSAGIARDPVPMVLAGIAAVFATLALGVAALTWFSMSSLETVAAAGGATPAPSAGQEQAASAAEQPLAAPPAASPGDLRSATYSPAYPAQSLQLLLPPCQSKMARYVDIDEPRVDADASRADLFYRARSGCYSSPELNLLGGATASVVSRSNIRPAQCVESVRNAPANSPIELTKAMNICILTSADTAIGQDISEKVALLVASAPDAAGSTTVRISGWHVLP